jgi:hypothetical protein
MKELLMILSAVATIGSFYIAWDQWRASATSSIPTPTLSRAAPATSAPPPPTQLPPTPAAAAQATQAPPPAPVLSEADEWARLENDLNGRWEKDWPGAIQLLDGFLGRFPHHSKAKDKLYAALTSYGKLLSAQRNNSEAVKHLSRAQELAPKPNEAEQALLALKPTAVPIAAPQPPPRESNPQPDVNVRGNTPQQNTQPDFNVRGGTSQQNTQPDFNVRGNNQQQSTQPDFNVRGNTPQPRR